MSEQQLTAALFTALGTLIGAMAKWILDQVTEARRVRREDRAAIGRLLADLITIWRVKETVAVSLAEARQMMSPLGLPIEVHIEIEAQARRVLPNLSGIHARYKEGLGAVAAKDPLLASNMQGLEEVIGGLEGWLQTQQAPAGTPAPIMAIFSDYSYKFREVEVEALRKHILTLARLHGWITWFRVRHHLNQPNETSPEEEELDSHFRDFLEHCKENSNSPQPTQEAG